MEKIVIELETKIVKSSDRYIIILPKQLRPMIEKLWGKKVRVRIEVLES